MQFDATSSPAEARKGVDGPRGPLWARLKAICREVGVGGLYHAGLLREVERLAGSYELFSVPGLRMPRLRRFSGAKFGILCYHRVGTEGVPLFSRLEPRIFEAQMRYVRKHYRVVPLGQLCSELREACPVEPTLAVTFDDGYRDLYTHAFPVLQKYEVPATIYMIGKSIETGEAPWYDRIFVALEAASVPVLEIEIGIVRRFLLASVTARALAAWEIVCYLRRISDTERRKWCAEFEALIRVPTEKLEGRMLDWQQVRTMHRGGMFFGAHTMTHPVVSRLELSALEEELARSKQLLERGLDAPVEDFAYPFGKPEDCSLAAEQFLGRCHYRSAVTTTEGFNAVGSNPYRLRRLQVLDDASLASFAFSVSRLFLECPAQDGPLLSESRGCGRGEEEKRILNVLDA
jgi:peptidoglycan/xylan/chitin deacetylase (PgdA/CDA1 family)